MKFFTPVTVNPPQTLLSPGNRIMLLGSCFADSIGEKMTAAGLGVCVNPFGTLYNPASILSAVRRLDSQALFVDADCVPMGAGAGRICSFEHHTSFARQTPEEFLQNANAKLLDARAFWQSCDTLILTLGTSFVWRHHGRVVSNCLKRPAKEFTRRMLTVQESLDCLRAIASLHPEKRLILTVSPIRHLGDGAHANTISKASMLLAVDEFIGSNSVAADYFPAYEIMMDELRDYRFYAEDLLHPTPAAVSHIWDRFLDTFFSPSDQDALRACEKTFRHSQHRPLDTR